VPRLANLGLLRGFGSLRKVPADAGAAGFSFAAADGGPFRPGRLAGPSAPPAYPFPAMTVVSRQSSVVRTGSVVSLAEELVIWRTDG
jgi:hypothetical protein